MTRLVVSHSFYKRLKEDENTKNEIRKVRNLNSYGSSKKEFENILKDEFDSKELESICKALNLDYYIIKVGTHNIRVLSNNKNFIVNIDFDNCMIKEENKDCPVDLLFEMNNS